MTQARKAEWFPPFCGVVFSFVLLLPYVFNHWRLADDATMQYVPAYLFQEWTLKLAGEWPHWALNMGIGQPATVAVGGTWFYPFQVLWGLVVGWSETSYLSYYGLHLAAGFALALGLARRLGLSTQAGLFFGMAFTGNGYVLGLLSNPLLVFPYLFWPGLISALLDLHSSKRARGMLAFAGLSILIETSGYGLTKMVMILCTAAGYWAVAREPGSWWRGPRWKELAIATLVAVAVTAPEWWTTIEGLSLMDRTTRDIYDEYTYHSPTNPISLATAILPSNFLLRDDHQLAMLWLERSWWVGSLTLGAVLGAIRLGTLQARPLHAAAIIALLAALFSMGGHSFFREWIAWAFPPFRHVRHPNNARLVTMGFLALLGAWSFHSVASRHPVGGERKWVPWLWAAFLALATGFGVSELDNRIQPAQLYFDASTGWKSGLLHTLFYLLLAYTAFSLRWNVLGRWKWPEVVVALQFLSMADAGYAFRHVVAKREPNRPEAPFSIPSPQPNERSVRRWLDGEDWLSSHRKPVLFFYNPPPHRALAYALADPETNALLSTLASCQADARKVLGPSAPSGLSYSCDGQRFEIRRYFGNTIEIAGAGPNPALLLVHDLFDPGWSAELNGRPVPIRPGLRLFKAVEIPGNSQLWTVRMRYRHPLFPLLWWVAAFGLAAGLTMPRWIPIVLKGREPGR